MSADKTPAPVKTPTPQPVKPAEPIDQAEFGRVRRPHGGTPQAEQE